MFPFKIQEKAYYECTWVGRNPGNAKCATTVDVTGHITGYNWGNCGQECPISGMFNVFV